MAEAAVEERPPVRFYCHICEEEFQNATPNFTCPRCSDGFIEELEDVGEPRQLPHTVEAFLNPDPLMDDGNLQNYPVWSRLGRTRSESGGGQSEERPLRTLTRLASSNLRQQLPVENLIQDFIINLGVGVNWGGPGNVQLFLGNPGDYAWGREGLDAIVTQLLNQMDSTGPPPVPKSVIDGLQVVEVSEEQVAAKLQCSVCWEHFNVKEQVRQLPCLHIYHEQCIRPWLELHGTCPICRQNLGGGDEEEGESLNDQTGVESATGQATNVQNVLRTLFGPSPSSSPTPSSSSSMDQSHPSSRSRSHSDSMM